VWRLNNDNNSRFRGEVNNLREDLLTNFSLRFSHDQKQSREQFDKGFEVQANKTTFCNKIIHSVLSSQIMIKKNWMKSDDA
jgi:hypothetical protein